jgi:hypothetical protein
MATDTNTGETILYAVLKLNTKISYTDPISGIEGEVKLSNCAGYVPIFDTMDEAIIAACEGKYQIVPVKC